MSFSPRHLHFPLTLSKAEIKKISYVFTLLFTSFLSHKFRLQQHRCLMSFCFILLWDKNSTFFYQEKSLQFLLSLNYSLISQTKVWDATQEPQEIPKPLSHCLTLLHRQFLQNKQLSEFHHSRSWHSAKLLKTTSSPLPCPPRFSPLCYFKRNNF